MHGPRGHITPTCVRLVRDLYLPPTVVRPCTGNRSAKVNTKAQVPVRPPPRQRLWERERRQLSQAPVQPGSRFPPPTLQRPAQKRHLSKRTCVPSPSAPCPGHHRLRDHGPLLALGWWSQAGSSGLVTIQEQARGHVERARPARDNCVSPEDREAGSSPLTERPFHAVRRSRSDRCGGSRASVGRGTGPLDFTLFPQRGDSLGTFLKTSEAETKSCG